MQDEYINFESSCLLIVVLLPLKARVDILIHNQERSRGHLVQIANQGRTE